MSKGPARAADAQPGKTPYETYFIEETRAAAEVGKGDYAAAVKALDAVLATRVLPPAESAKRRLTIVTLDYRLKDYAKTVAAAQQYYADGGGDLEASGAGMPVAATSPRGGEIGAVGPPVHGASSCFRRI